MSESHIHTPDDGRGMRRVFLNGTEVRYCVYADTKRGIVERCHHPLKLDRWKKRVLTYRMRGIVTVTPMYE